MQNTTRFMSLGSAVALLLGIANLADADDRSLVTVVGAGTSADGASQINTEIVGECIVRLPAASELQPVVDAESRFLKRINGDIDSNHSVRTYNASIELTYVVEQKRMVVVTTNSVERSEPVIREIAGRFDRSVRFESNSENGDQFAGRDLVNVYFFSTEESAKTDVLRRAEAWLKQKQSVQCPS